MLVHGCLCFVFIVVVFVSFGEVFLFFLYVVFVVMRGWFLGDSIPVSIEREELNRFVDPWDYRVAVHEEPILGNVDGNHSLPPVPEV